MIITVACQLFDINNMIILNIKILVEYSLLIAHFVLINAGINS